MDGLAGLQSALDDIKLVLCEHDALLTSTAPEATREVAPSTHRVGSSAADHVDHPPASARSTPPPTPLQEAALAPRLRMQLRSARALLAKQDVLCANLVSRVTASEVAASAAQDEIASLRAQLEATATDLDASHRALQAAPRHSAREVRDATRELQAELAACEAALQAKDNALRRAEGAVERADARAEAAEGKRAGRGRRAGALAEEELAGALAAECAVSDALRAELLRIRGLWEASELKAATAEEARERADREVAQLSAALAGAEAALATANRQSDELEVELLSLTGNFTGAVSVTTPGQQVGGWPVGSANTSVSLTG